MTVQLFCFRGKIDEILFWEQLMPSNNKVAFPWVGKREVSGHLRGEEWRLGLPQGGSKGDGD